ncbi:MAG: peptidase S58 family protein [Streptosporangiales bacterium]|nr:peptidase S58 family protein [Streptosporangiales bacterium]
MKRRPTALLLGAVLTCRVGFFVAVTPTASAETVPGKPGANNAITDVPGIKVGQVQSDTAPYLTGTSVVYTPKMSVAGVDQRGGAPATKETDLLSPLNSNPGVNAIQLGGSSMYGLSASDGIIRWLEDRGEGIPLGPGGVAPIVPAADIYDLGRGGDPKARTSAPWGYLAAEATSGGPVRQGSLGGGTGARAGGLRGGVGTASVDLGDGIYVGAMVIVNSVGSTVNSADCSLWGVAYGIGDEFAGYQKPAKTECPTGTATKPNSDSLNTTIAVVATNAPLEKAAAARMSGNAHDGMARAIQPSHTLSDGDTVFGVSTGDGKPLQVNNPTDGRTLNSIFDAGSSTLARAITRAILSAESKGTTRSYCDKYPSACADMPQLDRWRNAGKAPDVTPASFKRAEKKLKQTPVPEPGNSTQDGDSPDSDSEDGNAAAVPPAGSNGGHGGWPLGDASTVGIGTLGVLGAVGAVLYTRRGTAHLLLR